MGLHAINVEENYLEFHCTHPTCEYHNCANWPGWQSCAHHDTLEYVMLPAEQARQRFAGILDEETLATIGDMAITQHSKGGRTQGTTRRVPIDHADIQYVDHDLVAMPACDGTLADGSPCTSRLFVKVAFTEEEMNAPNIRQPIRHPANPAIITEIREHPMVAHHKALAEHLATLGRVYTPPPVPEAPAPPQLDMQALLAMLEAHGIKVVEVEKGREGDHDATQQ